MGDNDPNKVLVVTRWLSRLSALCRHQGEPILSDQKISDLAELLAAEFDIADFTTAALGHAAKGSEWFPAYHAIRTRLLDFGEARRPRIPRVGACPPRVEEPSDDSVGPGMTAAARDAVLAKFRADMRQAKALSIVDVPTFGKTLPDVSAKGEDLVAIRAARAARSAA